MTSMKILITPHTQKYSHEYTHIISMKNKDKQMHYCQNLVGMCHKTIAVKLDKEKNISYPRFGSSDRATLKEDGKMFHFSSSLVRGLRDPGSVPISKLGVHSSTKSATWKWTESSQYFL